MCLLITSQGERALVLGDAAHSPVQVENPDWVSRADMDPDLTRQTRRALLDRLEREEILVAAGHFEAPGFGRIVRLEGAGAGAGSEGGGMKLGVYLNANTPPATIPRAASRRR